jgi:hypothetical protein
LAKVLATFPKQWAYFLYNDLVTLFSVLPVQALHPISVERQCLQIRQFIQRILKLKKKLSL